MTAPCAMRMQALDCKPPTPTSTASAVKPLPRTLFTHVSASEGTNGAQLQAVTATEQLAAGLAAHAAQQLSSHLFEQPSAGGSHTSSHAGSVAATPPASAPPTSGKTAMPIPPTSLAASGPSFALQKPASAPPSAPPSVPPSAPSLVQAQPAPSVDSIAAPPPQPPTPQHAEAPKGAVPSLGTKPVQVAVASSSPAPEQPTAPPAASVNEDGSVPDTPARAPPSGPAAPLRWADLAKASASPSASTPPGAHGLPSHPTKPLPPASPGQARPGNGMGVPGQLPPGGSGRGLGQAQGRGVGQGRQANLGLAGRAAEQSMAAAKISGFESAMNPMRSPAPRAATAHAATAHAATAHVPMSHVATALATRAHLMPKVC